MKREIKYKDIILTLSNKKNSNSSFWVRTIIRKLSFVFTYVFLKLNWSANMVSYLSGVVGILGILLIANSYHLSSIIGALLINLWLLLDCVDGNVARYLSTYEKKKTAQYGSFIDAMSGYFVMGLVYFGIGIAAFYTSDLPNKELFIIIGGLSSIFDVLSRLIHQKYTNSKFLSNGVPKNATELKLNKNPLSPDRIQRNLGLSGFFMPALLISSVFNNFIYILLFYFIFNTLGIVYSSLTYARKAEREISKLNSY